jgi:HEPN domain-containing protein
MPVADRQLALARLWLSKARTDLALATVILEKGPEMEPWVAAFHAQQAAEKAVKGLLVLRRIEPPAVHNLVALHALVPAEVADIGVSMRSLASLSKFARGVRYVVGLDQSDEPTWEEAEAAVVAAGAILRAATAQIGRR